MSAPVRLGVFALALALIFGAAYAVGTLVPGDASAREDAAGHGHGDEGAEQDGHDHGSTSAASSDGLSATAGGYTLTELSAPESVGAEGALSFRVVDADGDAVTAYDTVHEEELHLIVVRSDGADFHHVHPTLGEDGTWTIPWTWTQAGTYRLYADFTARGGEPVVLGSVLTVAGDLQPIVAAPTRDAVVDGFEVYLAGNLLAGAASDLTVQVSRDGEPMRTLEPYLGSFGHLVVIRADDLAYLHVHPTGAEPAAGDLSGPDVGFEANVETVGRYLLYADFAVDGEVHTASFVVDAVAAAGSGGHEHGGDDHEH